LCAYERPVKADRNDAGGIAELTGVLQDDRERVAHLPLLQQLNRESSLSELCMEPLRRWSAAPFQCPKLRH
jgi:hypothetical protein